MEPKNMADEESFKLSKYKVKRFFDRLEKSPLSKLMGFQTNQEKIQAIIKFAEIVGIDEQRLPLLFNKLRKNTR